MFFDGRGIVYNYRPWGLEPAGYISLVTVGGNFPVFWRNCYIYTDTLVAWFFLCKGACHLLSNYVKIQYELNNDIW